MTQSESLVLKPMPKPRDDIPKEYFVNGLPYSKGFGSTGKQSEILAQEEEVEGSCNPGFGSSGKQSEILAPEEEVEGSYNPGVDYSNGRVSLDAQQNPIQVTEHSAGNLSPNTEHDEEVADGSLSVIDEQDQNEVSKNHDRLKPEIFYGPYRKSAAKPFISVIVIALCMICVLPGTTASKGYNQDAKKLQAHGKPQPSQQNAYETGRKIEDYRKQTEESRKRREVEDALLNKKGELQQEVRTERQMVASTAPPRDISRDKCK
ncbi:unnamed protein product [Mytilus edulis]|uniref:Uncharacterized protein n=1 Tax=Mytilus edulis TaxID=6550 RepID=A0A8S3QCL5_MYTED|nr:unnamed protein product [Mytilus edulis]